MPFSEFEPFKPAKDFSQWLNIDRKKRKINAELKSYIINDGGFKVFYIPAISLTGYGETNEEAAEMLKETMEDFYQNLVTMPESQMNKTLRNLGWRNSTFRKKRFRNTSYVDKAGVLRNFNLPKDTPIEESALQMERM